MLERKRLGFKVAWEREKERGLCVAYGVFMGSEPFGLWLFGN